MDATDIENTTNVEDKHWWYSERRSIIARELRRLGPPGRAIEIGAAGGGNSLTMMGLGWQVLATEYLEAGVRIARERGINAIQADARSLPAADAAFDLLVAFDVLEHIEQDKEAAAEMFRVVRPGGVVLIAVPCDMALWSAHDIASGHFRRYTRETLSALIENAGFQIESLRSWNVLLRPVVALRRRRTSRTDRDSGGSGTDGTGRHSEVAAVHPILNAALGAVVAAERYLRVGGLPGVSLMMRARRPSRPSDQIS